MPQISPWLGRLVLAGVLLLGPAGRGALAPATRPEPPAPPRPRRDQVQVPFVDWPPLQRLLTGAVFGRVGPAMVVAGGVDDKTVVWLELLPRGLLRTTDWQPADNLTGYAWSAAAQDGDALLLIGGLSNGTPMRTVRRWRWSERQLVEELLPELPEARWAAGAAVLDGSLFVLGGFRGPAPGPPATEVWELRLADLSQGPGLAQWRKATDLPQGLAHPVVAVQAGRLAVFGGLAADAQSPTGYAWNSRLSIYSPVARDATPWAGWREATPAPESVAGAAMIPLGGQAVVLLHGARLAPPRPADPGEPLETLLVYNIITDTWYRKAEPGQAASPKAAQVFDLWWVAGNPPRAKPPPAVEMQRLDVARPPPPLTWRDWLIIGFYFAVIVAVAGRMTRWETTAEAYALGGRQMPGWAAGLGMFAAGTGALTLLALPAAVFSGSLLAWLPVLACVPACWLQMRWIYPLLRRLELTSTFEYLERRFNAPLRLAAGAQFIALQLVASVALMLYVSAEMLAGLTGLPPWLTVLVLGGATVLYAAGGGFPAVAWTSVVQAPLLLLVPVIVLYIAASALPGGVGEVLAEAGAHQRLHWFAPGWNLALPMAGTALLAALWQQTVLQVGNQTLIQRVLATRPGQARGAALGLNAGFLVAATLSALAGLALFAYFRANPRLLYPSLERNEQLVPLFAAVAVPTGLAGLLVVGLIAAAMAAAAGAINSIAVVVGEDFHRRFLEETKDEERLLVLRRAAWGAGALGLALALILALVDGERAAEIWVKLAGVLGGGVLGVYALGMLTRRANGAGAGAGAIAGVVVMAALEIFARGVLHPLLYGPLALAVCVGFGYAMSLVAGPQLRDLRGLTVYDDP